MLEVRFKKVLHAFTLDVDFTADTEILALLGASGCGKSMTLKCIAGIEKPDEGRIALNGRVLYDSGKGVNLPPQQRRIGYLFQQYALFPNMTVYQNVAAGVRERDKAIKRRAVEAQLSAMRLNGLESHYPRQLSGGQQQRVALARILASRPELLLLDEPFAALDSYLKWLLELELSDTLADFGGLAIYVSHDRDEVYRLCQSVCVLDRGRSEPKQPVQKLFKSPETLAACLLTGCKNFTRIKKLSDGRFYALDWGAELAAPFVPDNAGYAAVRAHYIRPAGGPGENVLPCRVERVVDDTFSRIYMLSTPGRADSSEACADSSGEAWGWYRLRVEPSAADRKYLDGQENAYVHISPEDIMFLK